MKAQMANWKQLDWNLPNQILAAQTGAHHKTVNKWRKRLKQTPSQWPTRKLKGFVDWSKTNRELARIHGVSREYLSNLRQRWGAPAAPDANARGAIHTRDWSRADWSQTNKVLAGEFQCGQTTIRRARAKHAPPPAPTTSSADSAWQTQPGRDWPLRKP